MLQAKKSHLPADIVDECLVQELEHHFVVHQSKQPNKWCHAQKQNTENGISHRVQLVAHQLVAQPGFFIDFLRVHIFNCHVHKLGEQLHTKQYEEDSEEHRTSTILVPLLP